MNQPPKNKEWDNLPPSTKRMIKEVMINRAKASPALNLKVNGRPQYQSAPIRVSLSVGMAALENSNIIPPEPTGMKTNDLSNVFLNAIGVSVIESERGFTLQSNPESSENTEKTIIDFDKEDRYNNPNIMDNDLYDFLQNENILLVESFPNKNDPFYSIDQSVGIFKQKTRERIIKRATKPDLLHIGKGMTQLNLSSRIPYKRLKYFNGHAVRGAIKRSKF